MGSWDVAPLNILEALDLPGITNPAQIWIETRRLQYERIYRNVTHFATQPGAVRRAGPGDMVMLARDVLVQAMHAGQVVAVSSRRVEVDAVFEMEEGRDYAIRWRRYADDDDARGESIVRQIKTIAGEHKAVTLIGDGAVPGYGDVVHFGPMGTDSIPVIVAGIERGEDNASILQMLPAADEMHARVAAEVPPAWNGRVGVNLGGSSAIPPVPKVTSVSSGRSGTGDPNGLIVTLEPGAGTVVTARFEIQHRLDGSPTWSAPISVSAGSGAITIPGYVAGNIVEWQPRAKTAYNIPSAWGTSRKTTIGAKDRAPPKALNPSLIVVTAGLGKTDAFFTVEADAGTTTHVQLYRNTTGVFNESDATLDPIAVSAGGSYTRVLGDASRTSLLANGDFASAGPPPTAGAGWSLGTRKADHAAGSAGALSWTGLTLTAGKTYRYGVPVDAISGAGASLTPRLVGGTTVAGSALPTTGLKLGALVAASGNNAFEILAAASAVAQLGGCSLFEQTATSLPAGVNYIWLRPFNGPTPGALAGPFAVTVI